MEIKEIIEKGIEGGWDKKKALYHDWQDLERGQMSMEKMWLDPKFWEEVGKIEKWEKEYDYDPHKGVLPEWKYKMVNLMWALTDGKTIESFIKSL